MALTAGQAHFSPFLSFLSGVGLVSDHVSQSFDRCLWWPVLRRSRWSQPGHGSLSLGLAGGKHGGDILASASSQPLRVWQLCHVPYQPQTEQGTVALSIFRHVHEGVTVRVLPF